MVHRRAWLLAVLPGTHLHLIIPSGEVLLGLNRRVILFYESKQLLRTFYTLKLPRFTASALLSPSFSWKLQTLVQEVKHPSQNELWEDLAEESLIPEKTLSVKMSYKMSKLLESMTGL